MEANIKCYQCGGTQQLQMYDEEDGICQVCYDQQISQMLYYKSLRTIKYPEINEIAQGIYLGNEDAATSQNILKEKNITAICACGSYLSTPFSKDPNYIYKNYLIQDFPKQDIKQHFKDHYQWMTEMRKQKRNILIHCAAGVSRSASFTIAYFMKQKKMPFNLALKFVKQRRKQISPNSGFRKQLIEYHLQLGFPALKQQECEYFFELLYLIYVIISLCLYLNMLRPQKQEQIERENSPQTTNKPQKKTHKIKRTHNNRQITQYFPKLERKSTEHQPTNNLQQKSVVEQIDQTSLKLHEQEQALTQKRDQMLHLLQIQKEERDHYVSRIKSIISQQLKKMVEIDRIIKKHSLTLFPQLQEQRYNLVLEINQKQNILSHQADWTLRRVFLQREMVKLKKELKELDYKIAITQEEQRLAIQQDNCYFAKQKWPVLNKSYQILRLIGKGGFSQVYQAYNLQTNQRVAVKLSEVEHLLAGRENKNDYLRHIKRQYQVHKMLSHPSIVQLIEVLQINNAICIVLEYCQGETLAQMLKRQSQIQQKYAKLIIRQLLEVVKYLSMQKPSVVHYDLKPQNIMFQYGVLKVLDFGVCKTIDSQHSKMALTSQGIGTHCYLPPETFAMNNPTLSNKVDIWSIGVIFYQMLYGLRPFGQIGFPVSEEVDFPTNVHISEEAKRFIRQCLRISLKERLDPISALNDVYFST